MKRRVNLMLMLAMGLLLLTGGTAAATSSIIDVSSSVYKAEANDILTTYRAIGGYDVVGGTTYAWHGGSLKVLDNATGATVSDWGNPSYGGTTYYNSFVRSDGSGGVYAGFTITGNTDDRIYHIDSSGTWNQVATLAGNYDMEISGGSAYVSGLNGGSDNAIWKLDTSGSDAHDLIVQTSGYSAGLAFDNSGNAYYASYDNLLYTWDASAIAGAIGGTNLTYADGTKLADLQFGASDVDVDDAGNVIFNGNAYSSPYNYVAMWDGTTGDGNNYDFIGTGVNGAYMDWFGFLDSEGDVTAVGGGSLYHSESAWYGYYGIAEINAVPIPGAVWLMITGLLGFVRFRKAGNR